MVVQSFERPDDQIAEKRLAEGQNLIRACLFNLIVVCQDPNRVAHCQFLIQMITEKYPCKIIFVRQDPLAQSDSVRMVPGVQAVGNETNRVLCEVIDIEISSKQTFKIPFLILPHIVPDLPVYILLGHSPAEDAATLNEIERYASRVIYDTHYITSYRQFAQKILPCVESTTSTFIDLNWAKTKAWRETLAKAFTTQETLSQLAKSKMIQISYVEPPDHQGSSFETQAIYVQAWLAAKLKWKLVSVQKEDPYLRISYKYDHTPLTVSLVPKDTEILPPGAIFSFEAMTQGDYHFLIAHEHDSKLVKVHASNPDRCEMPYTIFLANFQNGPALVNEIFYQSPGNHYTQMLHLLSGNEWH